MRQNFIRLPVDRERIQRLVTDAMRAVETLALAVPRDSYGHQIVMEFLIGQGKQATTYFTSASEADKFLGTAD
jgi:hypothetical protein